EEALRQSFDIRILGRRGVAEGHRYSNDTDNRRDHCQRPDGAMRSEVLRVQKTEMLGRFVVLTHCVSDPRPGVHAGESSADDRQEHGEGLDEHEGPTTTRAE